MLLHLAAVISIAALAPTTVASAQGSNFVLRYQSADTGQADPIRIQFDDYE